MAKFRKQYVFLALCAFVSLNLVGLGIWTGIQSAEMKEREQKQVQVKVKVKVKSNISSDDLRTHHFHKKLDPSLGGVILHSKGGLGNQLFQFACSYVIAKERQVPLYHFFPNPTRSEIFGPRPEPEGSSKSNRSFSRTERKYVLDKFRIPLTNVFDDTSYYDLSAKGYLSDSQVWSREYPPKARFLQLTGESYCASPIYWKGYEEEILDMFRLREEIVRRFPPYVKSLEEAIRGAEESVAVHVRRGDFANMSGFGVPIGYQRAAIRRLNKILQDRPSSSPPKFFVFSDDIDYARRNLEDMAGSGVNQFDFVFVENRTTSIEDFFLMSKCKHFIIPDSTFSWWAAWLGRNWRGRGSDEGIVIASAFNPKWWVASSKERKLFYEKQFGQFYHPKEWIVIDAFEGEH